MTCLHCIRHDSIRHFNKNHNIKSIKIKPLALPMTNINNELATKNSIHFRAANKLFKLFNMRGREWVIESCCTFQLEKSQSKDL